MCNHMIRESSLRVCAGGFLGRRAFLIETFSGSRIRCGNVVGNPVTPVKGSPGQSLEAFGGCWGFQGGGGRVRVSARGGVGRALF